MAGLRLGYGLCKNRELLDRMCRLVQPWNVSTLAQAAGLVALDCLDWPEQARRLIQKEKPWLCGYLPALGFEVLPGDANYLFFSGAPGLYEKLRARGVLIRDCANYRGLQPGDCRIAVRSQLSGIAARGLPHRRPHPAGERGTIEGHTGGVGCLKRA